jgi:hypothetical protein
VQDGALAELHRVFGKVGAALEGRLGFGPAGATYQPRGKDSAKDEFSQGAKLHVLE